MLLFLYGKDTYRLQEKLKEIETQYKKIHKSGLNLETLNAKEISFRDFWDRAQQMSMFIKKKLFFLEEVFFQEKFKEDFIKNIKQIAESDDIFVVIEKKAVKKTSRLFKALEKHGKSQEFALLDRTGLRKWAGQEFKKYGSAINGAGLDMLIDFTGQDLWRLSNEVRKLASFKKGFSNSEISRNDIKLMVKPKIETAIFDTIDAFGERNKKKALYLIQAHLQKGDSPFYLLSMVGFEFRNLLFVKSCELNNSAKPKGMHPFVFQKTKQMASNFSFKELKRIFQRIFETDLSIKTSKVSAEQGLMLLVAEL